MFRSPHVQPFNDRLPAGGKPEGLHGGSTHTSIRTACYSWTWLLRGSACWSWTKGSQHCYSYPRHPLQDCNEGDSTVTQGTLLLYQTLPAAAMEAAQLRDCPRSLSQLHTAVHWVCPRNPRSLTPDERRAGSGTGAARTSWPPCGATQGGGSGAASSQASMPSRQGLTGP